MSPPLGERKNPNPASLRDERFTVLKAGFAAIVNDRWTEIETLNKRAKRFSVNSG